MNDEARPNLEPIEKMVDGLGVGAVFGEPIREGATRGTRWQSGVKITICGVLGSRLPQTSLRARSKEI